MLNQRYRLLAELTAGSDVRVSRAEDTLRHLPVLVKEYLPSALQDWKRFQLIEREAKILAQINHIEIPDFVDFFTLDLKSGQHLYLVTQWINGQSLSERLAQGWQPELDEVLQIAEMALALLVYIHAFNPPLVHRDIKPSNLMLSPYRRLFLIDFGGVQEALSAQGAGGSTLVGTLGYMAPEQLQGRAVPATDLYALGVTLLQLLTGEAPGHHTATPLERLQNTPALQDLPWNIQGWLEKMLAPDLDLRYETAHQALEELDALRGKDINTRTLYTPQDHRARIPEIIHSLTLTERSEADLTLVTGSLLEGRYEIVSLLGSGTHSHVYQGQIRPSGRAVVIKELCLEQVQNWKNLELFEREIAVLRELKHPRIPAFVDAFQVREQQRLSWYLVTEAVAGETLEQRIEAGWRPPDALIWQLALQLLDVLVYLHGLEPPLIHRDLKPSNILITAENELFVVDFGAVQNRLWAQGGGGSTIIGTFGYMAPELFAGQAYPQSDLYSLATTLIRLLSHRHPIEIPLEGLGLNFRPFVEAEDFYLFWLEALLKPDYRQRLTSAQEAKALLRGHLEGSRLARDWLRAQEATYRQLQSTSFTRRKRLLPSRLSVEHLDVYVFWFSIVRMVISEGALAAPLAALDALWGGLVLYHHGRYFAQRFSPQALPLSYGDFSTLYPRNGMSKPKPKLACDAYFELSPQTISLHNRNSDLMESQHFSLPWSDIHEIEITPYKPDYPHWQEQVGLPLQRLVFKPLKARRDWSNGGYKNRFEVLVPLEHEDTLLLRELVLKLRDSYVTEST